MNLEFREYEQGTQITDTSNGILVGGVNNTGAIIGYILKPNTYKHTDVIVRGVVHRALNTSGRGFLIKEFSPVKVLKSLFQTQDLRNSFIDDVLANVMLPQSSAHAHMYQNVKNAIAAQNVYLPQALHDILIAASSTSRYHSNGSATDCATTDIVSSWDLAYLESISLSPNIQDYSSRTMYYRVASMLQNSNGEHSDLNALNPTDINGQVNSLHNIMYTANIIPTAATIFTRLAGQDAPFHKEMNGHVKMIKKIVTEIPVGNVQNLGTYTECNASMMAIMKKIAAGQQLSEGDVTFAKTISQHSALYAKASSDIMYTLDVASSALDIIGATGKSINKHVNGFKKAVTTLSRCATIKDYRSAEKTIRDLYTSASHTPETIFNIDDIAAIFKDQENAGRLLGEPKKANELYGFDAVVGQSVGANVDNAFRSYVHTHLHPDLRGLVTADFMNDNREEIYAIMSSVAMGINAPISMSASNLLRASLGLGVMFGVNVQSKEQLFDLVMVTALTAESIPRFISQSFQADMGTVLDRFGDARAISSDSHPFISSGTGDFVRKIVDVNGNQIDTLHAWAPMFASNLNRMRMSSSITPNNINSLNVMFPGSFTYRGYIYKRSETDNIGAQVMITRYIRKNPILYSISACLSTMPSEWYEGGSTEYTKVSPMNGAFNALVKGSFNGYSNLLTVLNVTDPTTGQLVNVASSSHYAITSSDIMKYLLAKAGIALTGREANDASISLEVSAELLAHAFALEFRG